MIHGVADDVGEMMVDETINDLATVALTVYDTRVLENPQVLTHQRLTQFQGADQFVYALCVVPQRQHDGDSGGGGECPQQFGRGDAPGTISLRGLGYVSHQDLRSRHGTRMSHYTLHTMGNGFQSRLGGRVSEEAIVAAGVRVSMAESTRPLDHGDMVARAGRGHDGTPETPSSVRVAPLLIGSGATPEGRPTDLSVGRVQVIVTDADHIAYEIELAERWVVDGGMLSVDRGIDAATLGGALAAAVGRVLPSVHTDDPVHIAAAHAKAISEVSRNTVHDVRALRYDLEERLAAESGDEVADEEHTWIVSSVLKLNILCGRAVDQARAAVREGLWSYLDDADAYHSYRRLRDPTLIGDRPPATTGMRSWMRLHDTAVRQCEEIAAQLSEESTVLVGLLEAASSISSSREADAQTRLNLLVALLSLGLGVPALVLALYGAQLILPLDTLRQQVAFLPIAASLCVAAVLALVFAPKGQTRRIWIAAAIAVLVVLACLVVGAIVVIDHPLPQ